MSNIPKNFDLFEDEGNFKNVEKAKMAVQILTEQLEKGHGKSGYDLSTLLSPSCVLTTGDVKQALEVSEEKEVECFKKTYSILVREAEAGDGEAMHLLASYFQAGLPPVARDEGKYEYWISRAIQAGYRGGGQL